MDAIWDSMGPLLDDFFGVFSRVDFLMVFDPKWGGVGGMCGVPLGLRFCRYLVGLLTRLPLKGCGEFRGCAHAADPYNTENLINKLDFRGFRYWE